MFKSRLIDIEENLNSQPSFPMLPTIGRTFYVMKTTATGYQEFLKEKGNYLDGVKKVYNNITDGIAALNDYDTLIIAPGNYDEAAKISLDNLKGIRIFGYNTGFQWGEGSTNWRDVTSSDDLLDISGCQGIEIAGIGFVNSTAHDAINFDGLNYSVHIHDCNFTGDCGGGAIGVYAINAAGSNGPDLFVENCRFFRYATTAIIAGHQRNVISDCLFIIPASGKGIVIAGSTTASYNVIKNCDFLGANSSDVGIYTATSVIGNWMASNCRFAAVAEAIQDAGAADSDQNVVLCQRDDAGLGGVAGVDPEA